MIKNVQQEFLNIIKLPEPTGKKLNYMIVMPRLIDSYDLPYVFPLGLAYVSSALKASGRIVLSLNLNYKRDYIAYLRKMISYNNIDVVAVGGLSGQYNAIREIIDTAKSVNRSIITIVGGGIVTADPEATMEAFENADFGIAGEGEVAVNALCYALENDMDASMVEGVIQKGGILTPPANVMKDINVLPFPDYFGLDFIELMSKKEKSSRVNKVAASIELSRSCPFNCTFCFHTTGRKHRRRSLDSIFQEIEWLIDSFGVNYINFCDDLFINKSDFIYGFCEKVKKLEIKWGIMSRADLCTKEIFHHLKDSGCYRVGFGVESADNAILKSMNKNITVEQVECAFDAAIEAGLDAQGNIILGDLEETPETIRTSLRWLRKNRHYNMELYWILTFPGSYLYKIACEREIIKDRVKYLKDGKFQVNVTKMSDELYSQMIEEVDLFKLTRSSRKEFDPSRFVDSVSSILSKGKTALWPATKFNVRVFQKYASKHLESSRLFLVNSDVNKSNMHYAVDNETKKQIFLPDVINSEEIENVIVLYDRAIVVRVITELINESYPCVKRILQIDDLL